MIAKLIDCPACQKPVSAAAWKCPGCGHPLRSLTWRGVKYLVALGFLVIAFWLAWQSTGTWREDREQLRQAAQPLPK